MPHLFVPQGDARVTQKICASTICFSDSPFWNGHILQVITKAVPKKLCELHSFCSWKRQERCRINCHGRLTNVGQHEKANTKARILLTITTSTSWNSSQFLQFVHNVHDDQIAAVGFSTPQEAMAILLQISGHVDHDAVWQNNPQSRPRRLRRPGSPHDGPCPMPS